MLFLKREIKENNWKFGDSPKRTIDYAKDEFKVVTQGIGDAFNSMTKWRFW